MIEIGKRSAYLGKASPSSEGMSNGGVEILSPLSDFALNFIQGSVTPGEWAVVFGESPLSLPDAISTHLDYIKAFGKCAQADTPTPTVPVDIVCNNGTIKVKDDELPVGYKRLQDIHFDGNCYYETDEKLYGEDVVTLTLQADSAGGQNIFGAYSGTGADVSNLSLYIYANTTGGSYFRANQTLLRPTLGTGKRTISFGNGETNGFLKDVTYDVEEFETTDTAQIGALPNSSSPKFTGYLYGNITIGNRLKYIPCERVSDSAIGYYETVNGEFLENQGTGTLTTSGYDASHLTEIYYDGTVETVTTKQAFVNDSDIVDRTGLNSSNGAAILNNNRCYVIFPCKAGVTYTAQTDTADLIGGNFIEYNQPSATSTNFIKSITATDDGLVGGVYQFHAVCDTDGWAGWQCKSNKETAMANNWQITADTSTATCQPLLSVGDDYKDVQSIIDGAITRNVGIVVLTGYEDGWSRNSDRASLLIADILNGSNSWMPICTHYKAYHGGTSLSNMDDNSCKITSGGKSLLIKDTTHNTSLTDFTDYIKAQYDAGTPVILVYPLAEPTTETVTGQTMTIAKGDNVISAEGSLTGLELEAKYKKAS